MLLFPMHQIPLELHYPNQFGYAPLSLHHEESWLIVQCND